MHPNFTGEKKEERAVVDLPTKVSTAERYKISTWRRNSEALEKQSRSQYEYTKLAKGNI